MACQSVAVITISDTCSKDPTKDSSGPTLVILIHQLFPNAKIYQKIVPDEQLSIQNTLKELCDDAKVDLILTTGGTGLSKRDVTPEATQAVIHRDIPAISTAITVDSLKVTSMAMLSRAVAGVRNDTLIINFPGSKKAIVECFAIVKPVLLHAISLIKNDLNEVKLTHQVVQNNGHICPHNRINSKIDVSKVALRLRESPYEMIVMKEAYDLVDKMMNEWKKDTELVGLEEGMGRVIAEDVTAKEPFPPFPASVKDGYACLSSDGSGKRQVRTVLTAGDTPDSPLSAGECARINTGAALPTGADCVVQVEDTKLISASEDGTTEYEIEIMVPPNPGQDIRAIGSDIKLGSELARRGAILDAGLIGVLAGAGVHKVSVYVAPKVALLSTGNELQEPTDILLKRAHIRDSNRMMLRCLLREHGYGSIDCGIAHDEPTELARAIASAFTKADILVCTGGVSMGEKDLLKPVLLKDFNADLHFGRVRMKPGKPCTFASCVYEGKLKYVFALPGNPVSAYVCCLLFVIRALRVAVGLKPDWATIHVKLAQSVTLDPRPEFVRATLKRDQSDLPEASPLGNQCSSRLLSTCGAHLLLELPPAGTDSSLPSGTVVTALVTSRPEFSTS